MAIVESVKTAYHTVVFAIKSTIVLCVMGTCAWIGSVFTDSITPPPPAEVVEVPYTHKMDEMECLKVNLYHEARGEEPEAQAQVVYNVMNRVKSDKFPRHACEVVFQPNQYSWTRDKAKVNYRLSMQESVAMGKIVQAALTGKAPNIIGDRLYYERNDIASNHFAKCGDYRTTIRAGSHKFFNTMDGCNRENHRQYAIAN